VEFKQAVLQILGIELQSKLDADRCSNGNLFEWMMNLGPRQKPAAVRRMASLPCFVPTQSIFDNHSEPAGKKKTEPIEEPDAALPSRSVAPECPPIAAWVATDLDSAAGKTNPEVAWMRPAPKPEVSWTRPSPKSESSQAIDPAEEFDPDKRADESDPSTTVHAVPRAASLPELSSSLSRRSEVLNNDMLRPLHVGNPCGHDGPRKGHVARATELIQGKSKTLGDAKVVHDQGGHDVANSSNVGNPQRSPTQSGQEQDITIVDVDEFTDLVDDPSASADSRPGEFLQLRLA